ncbi:MAG: hypothetical protein QE263_05865 [Vampirovibrionales bacterium]|nr:hypothetical protein [Vampirovibrionales bacterium]
MVSWKTLMIPLALALPAAAWGQREQPKQKYQRYQPSLAPRQHKATEPKQPCNEVTEANKTAGIALYNYNLTVPPTDPRYCHLTHSYSKEQGDVFIIRDSNGVEKQRVYTGPNRNDCEGFIKKPGYKKKKIQF